MQLYCTLFDRNYTTRGLAMQRSLLAHNPDSRLIVLCLDQVTFDALSALAPAQAELVTLESLERFDPALARVRPQRKPVEYYWNCKPVLMKYGFAKYPSAPWITFLDSDLFFFGDLAPLRSETDAGNGAITPHRFPPQLQHLLQHGTFNAGWVGARNGGDGIRFIEWWRERCLEWCHAVVERDRFGDQKYLDRVPGLFSGVCAIGHRGANLAPWNVDGMRISSEKGRVHVEGVPLLFFHFHALRCMFYRLYDSGLSNYGVAITPDVRNLVYRPYLAALRQSEQALSGLPAPMRRQFASRAPAIRLRDWVDHLRQARRLIRREAQLLWQ
jgi:hypothetical protein